MAHKPAPTPARFKVGLHLQHQQGGTFLGFVIGLLVGLGLALAVAIYVTKVPIPFANRGQSRTPEQDAAEAKKNKDWDPNAPLYGKGATRPAAAASAASTEQPGATAPVAAPAAKASAAAGEARSGASADPLGDLAKAKSAGVTVDPFTYYVQAGAYRGVDEAEAQRAKLSLAGLEAKVSEREQSGRQIYRVRVGPLERKEDADKVKEKIEGLGMEAALVRVQR
jgi:cell division protein FtsN